MTIKTACVIQGNIRNGADLVLHEMAHHFDRVIISTWTSEKDRVPAGDYELILSDPPEHTGLINRNLQRVSSAAGLACARELGCDFVLKWRPDLLPTPLRPGRSDHESPISAPARSVRAPGHDWISQPEYQSGLAQFFSRFVLFWACRPDGTDLGPG